MLKPRSQKRDLGHPQQLENDQLRVTNDQLEIKIAKLKYREPDLDRALIDQFIVEQSKAAVKDAVVFAQIYRLSSSPDQELVELDAKLDDANEKCHARDDDQKTISSKSMAEAQAACSDLQAITDAIALHHIPTPQGWVSVYKEDQNYRTRTGYKYFLADTQQLRRDEVSHIDPKAKKLLIRTDRSLLIDDKQTWLTEMAEQETLEFDIKHPEHQMGDMGSILTMFKKFREDMAEINSKYRQQVRKAS